MLLNRMIIEKNKSFYHGEVLLPQWMLIPVAGKSNQSTLLFSVSALSSIGKKSNVDRLARSITVKRDA